MPEEAQRKALVHLCAQEAEGIDRVCLDNYQPTFGKALIHHFTRSIKESKQVGLDDRLTFNTKRNGLETLRKNGSAVCYEAIGCDEL